MVGVALGEAGAPLLKGELAWVRRTELGGPGDGVAFGFHYI